MPLRPLLARMPIIRINEALHLTFVTTYGLVKNAQYGMIQSEVTMDDLFKY